MSWTFYVRAVAAAVLVACLFLPLSTCTRSGQTQVTVPIRNIDPVALVLTAFCWPVLLLVAEALRPRLSTSGIVLVLAQPLLGIATYGQLAIFSLFEKPAIGMYLADGALGVLSVAAIVEVVDRIRARRRLRKLAIA